MTYIRGSVVPFISQNLYDFIIHTCSSSHKMTKVIITKWVLTLQINKWLHSGMGIGHTVVNTHNTNLFYNTHQVPLLSNPISLIHGSRIKWKSLSCQQFRPYSYQGLPHDTKFGNCRDKIVDSRAFLSWSLIHGSSWSGLIKVGPGMNANAVTHT